MTLYILQPTSSRNDLAVLEDISKNKKKIDSSLEPSNRANCTWVENASNYFGNATTKHTIKVLLRRVMTGLKWWGMNNSRLNESSNFGLVIGLACIWDMLTDWLWDSELYAWKKTVWYISFVCKTPESEIEIFSCYTLFNKLSSIISSCFITGMIAHIFMIIPLLVWAK